MAENTLIHPEGKQQVHHVIPVSCHGENINQNKISIIDRDHKLVHDTLDIAVRYYSKQIRNIREKTNHHLIVKPETVELRGDIQREYFSRFNQLTYPMQRLHIDSMQSNMKYRNDQYKRLAGDTMLQYREPQGRTMTDKFHFTHETYLDVKKAIAKEVGKILYLNNL